MKRNPTILLAEDDENWVMLMKLAFAKAECDQPFQVFKDGEQTIKFLEKHKDKRANECAALLLLDLKMPRKNGFDVLEWAKEHKHCKRLLVVVMSSSSDRNDVNKAYDLGVNSYLVKPSGLDELVGIVRMLFGYWMLKNETPDWA